MKKTLIVLMMVLLSAMLIVSCDDSSNKIYKVTFDYEDGDDVVKEVKSGEKVTKPADPTKSGNLFKYWSLNDTDEFDFNTAITGDITLKAVWFELPTVSSVGETVELGNVTWKALAVDTANKRALLISSFLCGTYVYSSTLKTYAESDIRSYLQSDKFLNDHDLDKRYMLKVDVTSDIEKTEISDSGSDYLFLLSKTEAENTAYFANDDARCRSLSWWLRSTVASSSNVYYVNTDGEIKSDRSRDNNNTYVRPAFWYSWN